MIETRTSAAKYLWERRSSLLDKAVDIRDAFWSMKMYKEDQRKRLAPESKMNRLGVRVRVQRGWLTCSWMRMEYSVSRQSGRVEKKNFWKHVSGKNPNTHRYPVSGVALESKATREMFLEIEDLFVEVRREQEELKQVYKSLKRFGRDYDEDVLLDLREFVTWDGDERLSYDPDSA